MNEYRKRLFLHPLAIVIALVIAGESASAQDPPPKTEPAKEPAATQPATTQEKPAGDAPAKEEKKDDKPKSYYVPSKAYGARLETEPPAYAKPLSMRGWDAVKDVDWLDFGLEHRMRIEARDDDLRRDRLVHDTQFLHRTRLYLGVHDIIDPFRFAVEFQDSRQFGSIFPENDRDVDENDVLQAYGELYFKDLLGPGQPLRFQAGRMSFDYIDRKLFSRNRWRNTTNSFDGFRLQLGQQSGPWQVDFLAAQPVERLLIKPDHGDDERWFYGVVGAWRKWSKYITIEPYYFHLDEQRKAPTGVDRHIDTIGFHLYGPIAGTNFDWDTNTAFQFGDDGPRDQCAFATFGELGYTFKHDWKPRLSVSGTYGSGDRDPLDNNTERFDRLFSSNHFRSTSDYIYWTNIISPKVRLEFQPTKKLKLDGAYGTYWLASDSDTFGATTRRDRNGNSGDFAGQEIELRARYQLHEKIELEVGYSYFIQGEFIDNTGPSDDSDFFYFQTTIGI